MAHHLAPLLKQFGMAGAALSIAVCRDGSCPRSQERTAVPFTDYPATFNRCRMRPTGRASIRKMATRSCGSFAIQHYGQPTDAELAGHKLKVTGLVNKPMSLTVDDLRKMRPSKSWRDSSARQPAVDGRALSTANGPACAQDRAGTGRTQAAGARIWLRRRHEDIEVAHAKKFTLEQFRRSLTRERAMAAEHSPTR